MGSFGLIIPIAEPGWHFGDTLQGNWTSNNTTLKLTIGDKQIAHPFFYKITKLTRDTLVIEQTSEDYSESFNKVNFVRQ